MNKVVCVEGFGPLAGSAAIFGAKNAVLVLMASLILTSGRSVLKNVPNSADMRQMILLLQRLGAEVTFDENIRELIVDTRDITRHEVCPSLMKQMRASILVMGPLLARFGKADIAVPGGCLIGARPIDYHLRSFVKLGVKISASAEFLHAELERYCHARIVLEYPSVGATENILMLAASKPVQTVIVNASLEPEVYDLIVALRKMGALIECVAPATIVIQGSSNLQPIEHEVVFDRLEAGALLLAAAITKGSLFLPAITGESMELFLEKLREMGHRVIESSEGITFQATDEPRAVSFVTAPYPGFPTDLQAPMMAALCLASGKSVVHEAVFENRFLHVSQLARMGAHITITGDRAEITGVDNLFGAHVIASDIRGSCALVLAGLAARGKTTIEGISHMERGYDKLEQKLGSLGARIWLDLR